MAQFRRDYRLIMLMISRQILQLLTPSENSKKAYKNRDMSFTKNKKCVKAINLVNSHKSFFGSLNCCSKTFGINTNYILRVCNDTKGTCLSKKMETDINLNLLTKKIILV